MSLFYSSLLRFRIFSHPISSPHPQTSRVTSFFLKSIRREGCAWCSRPQPVVWVLGAGPRVQNAQSPAGPALAGAGNSPRARGRQVRETGRSFAFQTSGRPQGAREGSFPLLSSLCSPPFYRSVNMSFLCFFIGFRILYPLHTPFAGWTFFPGKRQLTWRKPPGQFVA